MSLSGKRTASGSALQNGEIDAAIIANRPVEQALIGNVLFCKQFFVYAVENESVSNKETIKTADITDENLWLLDEGHCCCDQLMQFCRMEKIRIRQAAYRLGSLEAFMRMVESKNGITFIPEPATLQLSAEQKKPVRPFAIPRPCCEIVFVTRKDFVRNSVAQLIIESLKGAVLQTMLTLQPGYKVV